jgi:hypothetical protein
VHYSLGAARRAASASVPNAIQKPSRDPKLAFEPRMRLHQAAEFREVKRSGRRFADAFFSLSVLANHETYPRLGLSIATSVLRHRRRAQPDKAHHERIVSFEPTFTSAGRCHRVRESGGGQGDAARFAREPGKTLEGHFAAMLSARKSLLDVMIRGYQLGISPMLGARAAVSIRAAPATRTPRWSASACCAA